MVPSVVMLENAFDAIVVIVDGILIVVNPDDANADAPIVSMFVKSIDVNPLHPSNMNAGIVVTSDPNVTSVIFSLIVPHGCFPSYESIIVASPLLVTVNVIDSPDSSNTSFDV